MSIPVTTVDEFGIQAPGYAAVRAGIVGAYQAIYGTDTYLDPDSQDGQFLSVVSLALSDVDDLAVAVYNAFSPSTAQGAGLSSVVKINGLRRNAATNSTAVVTIVGQVGTVIENGAVTDSLEQRWNLPVTVTIPIAGTIDVTATAVDEGALLAAPNTITVIATPVRGWQTVTNVAAATAGAPVESDATLRRRQAVSTSLPAQSPFTATLAAIGNIDGVGRYYGYENTSDAVDANGLPEHSVSFVVEGGDVQEIAATIALKKTEGCDTYGTETNTVYDRYGVASVINFFVLTYTTVYVTVNINALTGFVSSTSDLIIASILEWINNLSIGEDVYYSKVFAPANLSGLAAQTATGLTATELAALGETFDITSLFIALTPAPVAVLNIPVAFNKAALTDAAKVVVNS